MGREATCAFRWGDRSGVAKVLLESRELIVRGELRERASFANMRDLRVAGEHLTFVVGERSVELALGAQTARAWAQKIAAPPPSLAEKFAISEQTRLYVSGIVDDEALAAAIACAASEHVRLADADLAIVRTDDVHELARVIADLDACATPPATWLVYAKGARAPLGETAVRDAMRASGFVDTKVASVSDRLSSLRFIKR